MEKSHNCAKYPDLGPLVLRGFSGPWGTSGLQGLMGRVRRPRATAGLFRILSI